MLLSLTAHSSYMLGRGIRTFVLLHQVGWSASITPFEGNLATQFHLRDVAAIAGFYAQDDHSSNVIVAM